MRCTRKVWPRDRAKRYARWGYGYQDKSAAERIFKALKDEQGHGGPRLLGVKLADVQAGRVDDFVLVWENRVEGNSIKWAQNDSPMNWGGLVGAAGLLKDLASGFQRLKKAWPEHSVLVRLQTSFPGSEKTGSTIVTRISVAQFLADHWERGRGAAASDDVREAWKAVESHTGLSGEDLDEFVGACELCLGVPQPPIAGPENEESRHYLKQFKRLYKALATWITDNPDSDFVGREFLFAAIGLQHYQSELVQRFPSPQIPYERNQSAADRLRLLLNDIDGGYVAVTGCAGGGKSTLVQDVLDAEKSVVLIRYFAYLPDGLGNPRDRGEALTFFRYVVGRLDRAFPGRTSVGIDSIIHGRHALREHMARANKEFVANGRKTVLLIDGLDHVAREVGLRESILRELPTPSEMPDGFLIVLSARPEALLADTLGPSVSNAIASSSGRRVTVNGLSRSEVHLIVSKALAGLSLDDRERLFRNSAGNPLILTYLLNVVRASSTRTVAEAITDTARFDGDIDAFYAEALAAPLEDSERRRLLGLLCRAAPTIPVDWLLSWPEQGAVEDLYKRVLEPFTRVDQGNVSFIHNSLISFLVERTRWVLPGADQATAERDYYSRLADRSSGLPCRDPLGRGHVFFLARAERFSEVLEVTTSAWLRESVREFVPYAMVRPTVLEATRVAWRLGEFGHVVRLILLDSELHQRSAHLDAEQLGEAFLNMGEHELALAQLQANGMLLVDNDVALSFSRKVWFYASEGNSQALKEESRKLYEDSKPIGHLQHGEPVKVGTYEHGTVDTVRKWCLAAPLFEPIVEVIDQIMKLDIPVEDDERKIDVASERTRLLFASLKTAVRANLGAGVEELLLRAIVEMKKPDRELAALLLCAREGKTNVSKASLLDALSRCHDQPYLALDLGEHLYSTGDHDASRAIVESFSDGGLGPHSGSGTGSGPDDLAFHASLTSLREQLGVGPNRERTVESERDEAMARVELAARRLGELRSQAARGEAPNELRWRFRDVLLYESQAVKLPNYNRHLEPSLIGSRWAIFDELLDVANAFGFGGMSALRNVVLEVARSTPTFLGIHCRRFAVAFNEAGVLAKGDAIKLALSYTADAAEDDPMVRQEACLAIAACLRRLGADDWREWIRRAGSASAGSGSHKDYRMAHIAAWLDQALVGKPITARGINVLEKFTRALEVAGGDGQADAAADVLGTMLRAMPSCAAPLAVEMIDRNLFSLPMALEALTVGGTKASVSPELLSAIFEELLSIVSVQGVGRVAASIVEVTPEGRRRDVAESLMSHVRTNCLPSTRVEIARDIQDALARSGYGVVDLTDGFSAGADDASRRFSLYKLPDGRALTAEQVATKLRSAGGREEWDPNPAENAEFDWWEPIRRAGPLNLDRLDEVLANCSIPAYRRAEHLALRSMALRERGWLRKARENAEEALKVAADQSWFTGYDGGQRRSAFRALRALEPQEANRRSREAFGNDLASGNLDQYFLIKELVELFEFLEIGWPEENVLELIDEYVDEVLSATGSVDPYRSFYSDGNGVSSDEAVGRFLVGLFAIPAVDIAWAARRAFSSYLTRTSCPFLGKLLADSCWSDTELECILIAIDAASRKNPKILGEFLRGSAQNLNRHESLAVRSVARQICARARWVWVEVRDEKRRPRLYIGSDVGKWSRNASEMLVGRDAVVGWQLFSNKMLVLEAEGISREEIESEFEILFSRVADDDRWSDDQQVGRWTRWLVDRRLRSRVLVGRAAAMRLLGRYALEGVGRAEAEKAYDSLYPIYDPALELMPAAERPPELRALDWDFMDAREQEWVDGSGAEDWGNYPQQIGDLYLIGEVSYFTRFGRDRCHETRFRGVLGIDGTEDNMSLSAGSDLTHDLYRKGLGPNAEQIVGNNGEGLLAGAIYRWPMLNAQVAARLGWKPSPTDPFGWLGSGQNPVVTSVFWRDGRIEVMSHGSESLGVGWCLLTTEAGLQAIRKVVPGATVHLLIKRERRGANKFERSWRLAQPL